MSLCLSIVVLLIPHTLTLPHPTNKKTVTASSAVKNATKITTVANQTRSAANSRIHEAVATANATFHNITGALNQTLADLRHKPLDTIKQSLYLTTYQARLANLTANLNPFNHLPISGFNFTNTTAVKKLLNQSAAADVKSLWSTLQGNGLQLPNITSVYEAITPNWSVPGLQGGAANAVEALVKVGKAVYGNDTARTLLLTVLPKILNAALKAAAASAGGSATTTATNG